LKRRPLALVDLAVLVGVGRIEIGQQVEVRVLLRFLSIMPSLFLSSFVDSAASSSVWFAVVAAGAGECVDKTEAVKSEPKD
jgi:hypothetical protein